MNKKIAVVFNEDIYCQRGLFNAVRNRVRHLKDVADFEIDVYVIGYFEPLYIRILRKTPPKKVVSSIELDGITYHALWYQHTIIDYLLETKLHLPPVFSRLFFRRLAKKIRGYNLISAHSTECGLLASRISKREGIPFCVTWHGTDIHTAPFKSKSVYKSTEHLLKQASCNFFVSDNLRKIALEIAPDMKCELLYNGRNELFRKYSVEKRTELRRRYGVLGSKVIAFAGHLIEVKNPQLLAPIFASVQSLYNDPLSFWIIGSGKMQNEVRENCDKLGLNVCFWGSQPADRMPEFMNCIDVLVLPSRNEGLPLVAVEAISCGANVVGSNVGGIREVIGDDNVFSHGSSFIEDVSKRIVRMLTTTIEQPLHDVFNWKTTSLKELDIYNQLL